MGSISQSAKPSRALQRLREVAARKKGMVAARIGVVRRSLEEFLEGAKTPGPETKKKIEAELGIPVGDWKKPPVEGPISRARSAPLSAGGSFQPPKNPGELVERLSAALAAAEADPLCSWSEKARLGMALTTAMRQKQKAEAPTKISEATLANSEAFVKVMDTVFEALAKYPNALASVRDALRALEEKGAA